MQCETVAPYVKHSSAIFKNHLLKEYQRFFLTAETLERKKIFDMLLCMYT